MMNRDELEQLMVSQLYGEGSSDDRRRLEEWFDAHPQDRAEFDGLRRTCTLLDRLRSPEESGAMVVELPPGNRFSPRRWRGWMLAAAAGFTLLFLAGTQGFILQIGSFRVGMGTAAQTANVKDLIREELSAHYFPTLNELVQTVGTIQTSRDLVLQRQAAIEQSLIDLAAIQKINERKVEMALNELVDGIDERLRPFLAAGQPTVYRAMPVIHSSPN